MDFFEPEIKIEFLDCENELKNKNPADITQFRCGEIMYCQNNRDGQIKYNLKCLHCNLIFSCLPEFAEHFNEIYPLISILNDTKNTDDAIPAVGVKQSRSRDDHQKKGTLLDPELSINKTSSLDTISIVKPEKTKCKRTKKCKRKISNMVTDDEKKINIAVEENYQNSAIPESRECYVCKKVYKDSKILRDHLTIMHSEKTFQCKFCNKMSATIHRHKAHESTHNKSYNFMCNYCGKKYERPTELNVHIRIHTGEKPFKCNYCKNQFTRKCHLIQHERVHTGEKPFKCHFCDKTFTHHAGATQHEKWMHKDLLKASGKLTIIRTDK